MLSQVENGRIRIQKRLNPRADPFCECNLDEDERFARERRVKERVAPPVCREPPPEIVPALNLMDRLVLDQALEHGGRGLPVDPAKHQKTAVEPRPEQVCEVAIDAGAFRVRPQRRDEMAAHLDEGRRACRGQVQATEEFLPRRFGSRLQPQERVGGWLSSVGLSRSRDPFRIGQKNRSTYRRTRHARMGPTIDMTRATRQHARP